MDPDILRDYLAESRELLERAQADTLRLEKEPENGEILASLFRAFHTVKGGASFLEADNLVTWAHQLETLLENLRSRVLPVTSDRIDGILRGSDVIQEMLQQMAEAIPPTPGPSDLGTLIRQLAATDGANSSPSSAKAPQDGATEQSQSTADITLESEPQDLSSSPEGTAPASRAAKPEQISEIDGVAGRVEAGSAPRSQLSVAPANPRTSKGADNPENSLRIDAQRLDAVMNQVGELVLLRNRLASAVGSLSKESEDMSRIAREMNLTVNDIQSTVMRLRMQPCKRLFQQLPRVVRDISRQLGKDVRLEVFGEDVEIDKTVVDALSGPLTHLIRNSMDHGIELPAVRSAANKPCTALVRVGAVHLGDKVRIEVSDDGQGIDRRFVTQKAIDKGILTTEQASHLSEQEALELIFRPGFSTKESASNLSGRGVGMDVVRETTHKLRGRLSIDTRPGKGTSIAMEFPLTMAVLPVLYLRLRQDTYALPIASIDSLIDLEENRVHRLAGNVTYRVDGTQTVPLVDLGAILQKRPLRVGSESVEGVLTERGLFIVSEVLGNEDSVIKPIDFLNGQNLYQGATISGRGNVVLILDAGALSAAAPTGIEGSC